MKGVKGHPKWGGRQKGTPNKLSLTVKDNVIEVFNKLGGIEHMATWASANTTEFYKIYSKLIPTDLQSSDGSMKPEIIIRQFVLGGSDGKAQSSDTE